MDPAQKSRLGPLHLTQLGFGGAGIGNLGGPVSDRQAREAMTAAWQAGVRYFDTAPWYGIGLSEHRVGAFLRGQPRQEYVLSTKVGRLLKPWPARYGPRRGPEPWVDPLDFEVRFDYSYGGIVRAWEDSLQRLGLPAVDMLVVHDLDHGYHHPDGVYQARLGELSNGGFDALRDLRAAGKVSAIGAGVNVPGTITDILDRFAVDFFLVAGPYTLVEQQILDTELARAAEAGAKIVIGAAYRSGLLATGSRGLSAARRSQLGPELIERADRLEALCLRHGVPLAAAALQFPLAHPAVVSLLAGGLDADQVRQSATWLATRIPDQLWVELKERGLLPANAPVPLSSGGSTL
ncbi:MAG: aldo/keto reductase [Candidatus Dormibacteraceae bacterium]